MIMGWLSSLSFGKVSYKGVSGVGSILALIERKGEFYNKQYFLSSLSTG